MDLELTDDQELFRETTAKFIENTCPLSTVREWAEKEPAGYPADWWRQGAELGWTSLLVSEEDGGGSVSGHGLLDLTLVAEVMGHWVSPGPLLPTNVVAAALSEFGTPAQKERYLPGLLVGGDHRHLVPGRTAAVGPPARHLAHGDPRGAGTSCSRARRGRPRPQAKRGSSWWPPLSTARSPSSWSTRTLRA